MKNRLKIVMTMTIALIASQVFGQVRIVNSATNSAAINGSAFIDASSNSTTNPTNNIGKGLLFPRTDLTTFSAFSGSPVGLGSSYPTRFDGMIVYNTGTGSTLASASDSIVSVTPGFYYYDNKTTNIKGGKWKRIDATTTDISKLLVQSPARDSIITVINSVAKNTTTSGSLITVTNGTGATLTPMTIAVDTTSMKTFVTNTVSSSPTKDSIINIIKSAGQNTTAGSLITVTNGSAATLTAMNVAVDTNALKTFISNNTKLVFANNGLTKTADTIGLGGSLTAATTITTSATNTLALAGLQSGSANDSILVINPTTGVISLKSPTAITTTNTLSSSVNTITSTVNGVVATAPAVNSVANAFNASTRELTTTINGVAGTAVVLTDGPDSTSASNGLTMTGKDVKLGGSLTSATTVTTSATNTLALAGLQSGTTSDSIVMIDGTTGVLKKMSSTVMSDKTQANNGLTKSGDTLQLGGTLSKATTVTTSATNTLSVAGLQSGSLSDSLVVADATTGALKRLSTSALGDKTQAENGLTKSGDTVKLGGSLTAATTVTTSASNTLALAGLQSGTTSDSIVMIDGTTGVLKKMSTTVMSDKTQANNGLTKSGDTLQLGGTLSKATTVTTSATNTLALTGLQSGSLSDSLVVADATTGALKRLSTSALGDKTQAENGLTKSGDTVKLGGSLTAATTVTTSASNTLALAGLQSGTTSDSIVMIDGTTGVLKKMSTTVMSDKTQANNGLTKSGDTLQLGGTLSKATTVTTSATNTLALTGLQSGSANDSILVVNPTTGVISRKSPAATTNALTAASDAFTSTVNGVASTLTPSAGTITTKFLGFDASGNLVTDTALTTTTNTLGSSVNTITSTVNGVVATAPAVNSVANAFNASTRELTTTINGVAGTAVVLTDGPDSTSASNGLTLTGKDVKLGGSLTAATTVTTSASNTLALAGLQSGTTSDSIVMIDGTTGVLKKMSTTVMSDKTQANNGLTKSGDTLQLGGTLSKATTVTTSATNTLSVAGLQSGSLSDSLVVADATTGALKRLSTSALGDKTQAENGLTKSGDTVKLGGSLTAATTVTTSASNTLALAGLQSGTTSDSIVMIDGTTGVLKKMSTTVMSDKTQANNGLTKSGDTLQLGGTLSKATTVTTSATNTLALTGLQSGSANDSILVVNPTTGVISRKSPAATTNALTAASDAFTSTVNGVASTLTPSAGTITTKFLGFDASGNLVTDTALTTTTNTLGSSVNTITSTVNGVVATAPAVNSVANAFNASTRELTTTINGVAGTAVVLTDGPDSTSASNGLTLTGKDVKLGGSLTAATTVTTSASNTLALAGLQSGTTSDSIVMIDGTTGVLKKMSTTVMSDKTQANNGLTKSGDTLQLGGTLSKATTVTTSATNTLSVAGLQSGSLSDSLVVADATTGALKRLSTSALGDKTQAENGLTKSGDTVKLGGSLTAATTVTTSASNTLALAGLQSGTTSDSIVMIDGTTGVLKKMSTTVMSDKTQANNGLTKSGDTVQLGGTLSKATTVTTSATNTLALAGLQSGATTDSILIVNPSTGVVSRISPAAVVSEPWNKVGTTVGATKNTDSIYVMGNVGIGTNSPAQKLHVNGQVEVDTLKSGAAGDSIITAGSDGVLKKKTMINAMDPRMKFFYAPSISIPVNTIGTGFTINLYDQYTSNFSTPAVKSTSAPAAIPVFSASELNYYISKFDPSIFANVSISDTGIMTYDVISTTPTYCSFVNAIFTVK